MKTALITGVLGQDGSYLAELLLEKGYKVYGLIRRSGTPNFWRINHIKADIEFVEGDLADLTSLHKAVKLSQPDEIYNLAAQSFVPHSWTSPELTSNVTGLGVLRMLEATKENKPDAKFYSACSSEQFGNVRETPQTEKTPFYPRSPYGVAKVYAHWITVNYRESYDMFACNGILFNHESPRRGLEFVTRKISSTVAKIKKGEARELRLGNLDAKRDWGHAKDYCRAMWLMLQQNEPDDYVVATGACHTVREFCEIAFNHVGLDYKNYVKVDEKFIRPAEVLLLQGDATKIYKKLGWEPKISFEDLVHMMVDFDMEAR